MKLLFDHNLSHRLVSALQHDYPDSTHVRDVGLSTANDADFHQRSFLFGHPPKVVWIRVDNCSTSVTETLLHRYRTHLQAFAVEPSDAFLTLE